MNGLGGRLVVNHMEVAQCLEVRCKYWRICNNTNKYIIYHTNKYIILEDL